MKKLIVVVLLVSGLNAMDLCRYYVDRMINTSQRMLMAVKLDNRDAYNRAIKKQDDILLDIAEHCPEEKTKTMKAILDKYRK